MEDGSELVISSFSEFAGDAAPSFAARQMESAGSSYAVVFDSEGLPAGLATMEDVQHADRAGAKSLLDIQASIPAAILAPENTGSAAIASHPTVTLLEFGARGAVLMAGRTVKGILPASAIVDALVGAGEGVFAAGRSMGVETHFGDIQLGGVMNVPVARIICRECGYVNQIDALDPDRLPSCENQNPPVHVLKVR